MQKGATERTRSLSRRNSNNSFKRLIVNNNFKHLINSHLVLCTNFYEKWERTSFTQHNFKRCLTCTQAATRYLRLWKRLSTEKLLKQSILYNYNLRITKAGLAITEVRVNQHEILLHAQEWTCTGMLFNSDGSNSSTATYPHDFTAIRKMEVKSSKELYIIHFLCPPPRGPQPRKPPFTKVSPPNSCDCQ